MVSPISTFMLNTLTLSIKCNFFNTRQGLDQLESPATMVLHWHPHPVSDVVFTNDGMLFLTLLCALIIGFSGHYLIIAFKWLTIFPGSTLYVILVKSN